MSIVEGGTEIMYSIKELHHHIMYYIIVVVVVVTLIIILSIIDNISESSLRSCIWSCLGFTLGRENHKKVSHSGILEIVWTITPGLILVSIGIPSYKLLYLVDEIYRPSITVKVKGMQWNWEYSINNEESYLSYTIDSEESKIRLLDVDRELYLPVNRNIRILIYSDDVIHSFAVPGLGIKLDAIPGRINQTFLKLLNTGKYYGQCSELCGINHHNMSIVLNSVSNKEFLYRIISNSNIFINDLIAYNLYFLSL